MRAIARVRFRHGAESSFHRTLQVHPPLSGSPMRCTVPEAKPHQIAAGPARRSTGHTSGTARLLQSDLSRAVERGGNVIFHSPYPPVAIPAMPFSEFIFANVAHWRDQPAFVDGPTGRTLTHGQMYRAARNVGAALQQRRMRKGDVFAIVCPNVPEYGIAFH